MTTVRRLLPERSTLDSNTDESLSFEAVSKSFRRRAEQVKAIKDFNLSIRSREFVALLGPSGCGKSTVLRIALGLEKPDAGTVSVLGGAPSDATRAQRIGVAFQDHALLPWLTAKQNVALPFRIASRRIDNRRVDELLTLVGLASRGNSKPRQLSGGMRQRVAVARALALGPELLLLDEPFGALDVVTRRRLNLELQRIWSEHAITTMLVTHSVDEAVFLADRIAIMSAQPGQILATYEVPFARPRTAQLTGDAAFQRLVATLTASLDDASDQNQGGPEGDT